MGILIYNIISYTKETLYLDHTDNNLQTVTRSLYYKRLSKNIDYYRIKRKGKISTNI